MNNHQKGFHRDRLILNALEKHRAMDTDQITSLFFKGIKNSKRMAQKRLKKLHEGNRVNRCRLSHDQPYYYYVGKKPGQPEHLLGLSWVYLWLNAGLKTWERIHCFEYEQVYGNIRVDGFAAVKNVITGKMQFTFVEMDRAESGHEFTKVKQYNDFYGSDNYSLSWWVKLAERFPAIVIITTGHGRLKAIEKRIEQDNKNGLEFKVYLMDDLKGECLHE